MYCECVGEGDLRVECIWMGDVWVGMCGAGGMVCITIGKTHVSQIGRVPIQLWEVSLCLLYRVAKVRVDNQRGTFPPGGV